MANPTNADILNAVLQVESTLGNIEARMKTVEEQTKKTNGRVTKVEEWKNAIQAVDNYKKEQALVPVVKTESGDVIVQAQAKRLDAQTRVFLAIAGLIAAATVVLSAWGGKL